MIIWRVFTTTDVGSATQGPGGLRITKCYPSVVRNIQWAVPYLEGSRLLTGQGYPCVVKDKVIGASQTPVALLVVLGTPLALEADDLAPCVVVCVTELRAV